MTDPSFPPEPWTAAHVPDEPDDGELRFTCPRCGTPTTGATYAPCAGCRAELRDRLGSEQREVAEADYVPKVNVTPNAVATKE